MIEEHPAALITGGAQGIGKGIAQSLLLGGWRVLIADTDSAAGAETAEQFGELDEIHLCACDVSQETDVVRCVSGVGPFPPSRRVGQQRWYPGFAPRTSTGTGTRQMGPCTGGQPDRLVSDGKVLRATSSTKPWRYR
jgi:hypothetical protein